VVELAELSDLFPVVSVSPVVVVAAILPKLFGASVRTCP